MNVRAYTQYANCRAVSPRRLDIHAVVSVAFCISGVKQEEIITGAEGAGIQLRCCDSRTASLIAWHGNCVSHERDRAPARW